MLSTGTIWTIVGIVLLVLALIAVYATAAHETAKFYVKCATIKSEEGTEYYHSSVESTPEGLIIHGFVVIQFPAEGGPSVSFLIKNPEKLGDNLKVSYTAGKGYLEDIANETTYGALQNEHV